MNILFYPTSLNTGYITDTCEILQNKNKNINFGFIHQRKRNLRKIEIKNLEYLKKKKLKCRYFYLDEKKKELFDKDYLEYFEKLSKINIWKIISSDRIYGRVYINDIHAYRSTYDKGNSKKILQNFIDTAKYLERIFINFKPNIIYISNGTSNIEASILDSFAKFYNVKILVPETSRFKNYFFFSPSIYASNDKIKKYYLSKKNNSHNNFKSNIFYNDIKKLGAPIAENEASRNQKFYSYRNFFQKFLGDNIYAICKHIFFYLLFLIGFKIKHLNVLGEYNLISSIKDEIYLKKMLKKMLLLKSPNLKQKYVYFPLHLIPETSTLLMGNDFMNQGFLVELISKSIPSDCKLYVKEHPSMFSSHGRKAQFYKRLKLLPNVELVPVNINGIKLIKNSELVIVVDGSSGFEALLMGKPVVTMKYFIYSFMNLNETNYNINNLYLDIKNAIKKNKKISAKVLEKKVKRLIQSIMSTSYTLRRSNVFYYNDKNFTLEDQKICGEDLAKAMIKELKITSR